MRLLFVWRPGVAPAYYGELTQEVWQPEGRQLVYDALISGNYEGMPDDPRPCFVHDYEANETWISMPNMARDQMIWTNITNITKEPWSLLLTPVPEDVLHQVEGAWQATEPDGPPEEVKRDLRLLFLEVFFVQQCYGGREEGGWYYEEGIRCRDYDLIDEMVNAGFQPRIYPDVEMDSARAETTRLQKWLDETVNRGRPPLHSVNSRGRYLALLHSGEEVTRYPAERPRYE